MRCDLSIVIVNYNVQHFLRQTLESVFRAQTNLSVEVFVVDNNSKDDSVAMVKRDFAQVKLIANQDNPGFSKANNQAIRLAKGKYVLLLNPDTILQEDTLQTCFDFMEAHPDAGAVGAKMLDGSGQFLPESKRGFPSPWVSFCKATGLSVLFPKSKVFNQYHLGFLDENQTHEVDVLCGAFMFMRKDVLDEVGMLDEDFFMYGEDIDLSYRIKKAGHKVYYLSSTQLIHFKGESTKKSSVNYVRVFYKAMIIFAKKHFAGKGAGLLILMLNLAIFGRALLSLLKRFAKSFLAQILDFVGMLGGLFLVKEIWEQFYFQNTDYFPATYSYNLIGYSLIYVLALGIHGVYKRNYKVGQLIRAIFVGLVLLLAIYALMPIEYRYSRAIVLLSGVVAVVWFFAIRLMRRYIKHRDLRIGQEVRKRIFIIGSRTEAEHVESILKQSMRDHEVVAKIASAEDFEPKFHTTTLDKIEVFAELEKANEFIFCVQDLEWQKVIELMNKLGPSIEYKMVGDDRMSILGSKSKNTSGELYSVKFEFNLAKQDSIIKKRVFDIVLALVHLLFFWILIWGQAQKSNYFKVMLQVLMGSRSFVGYDQRDPKAEELPHIKIGLIDSTPKGVDDLSWIHRANLIYAKDYNVWKDIEIILKKWKYVTKVN